MVWLVRSFVRSFFCSFGEGEVLSSSNCFHGTRWLIDRMLVSLVGLDFEANKAGTGRQAGRKDLAGPCFLFLVK